MEDFRMAREKGNAFVYILIAVALFAALSFVLARQEDAKEANVLTPETAKLMANQIISVSAQVQQALDQMTYAGTPPEEFDFTLPSDGTFNDSPTIDKVYHPDGGGVILGGLPANAIADSVSSPSAGWYLGRFNSVDWTDSTTHDVILTAFGLNELVCGEINRVATGSTTIPSLSADASDILIDDGSQTNADFTTAVCSDCEGITSLCVQSATPTRYAYYSILFGE
jgi:hypothetical protein